MVCVGRRRRLHAPPRDQRLFGQPRPLRDAALRKDFAPIAELATAPNVFAVKPELGVGTMKDFVALAKKDPARFNISSPAVGTTLQRSY
jgi:hypothetical protein